MKSVVPIFTQIADCIEDPCFAIDRDGSITAWNEAMEVLTGILSADMIGKSEYEYALPLYGSRIPLLIDNLLQTGSHKELSERFWKKEGETLAAEETFPGVKNGESIFKTRARPVQDTEGNVIGGLQTFHDITEYKRSQDALLASEQKYRTFFENVTDFLYIHDFEGNMIETNLALKIYTGYSQEDLKHMNIKDIMPEAYRNIFDEYQKVMISDGKGEGLISVLTKDGRERVLEYKNVVVRDAAGNPTHVQGAGRDITDKIKAERALKLSEEKYRNILDSIEEAYFEVDLSGNMIFFNQTLARYLEYSNDELKGINYRQYMDEENAKKVSKAFNEVFITGEPIKAFYWELMDKNKKRLYAESSVSLLRDSRDKVIGFKGVVRDITQRIEAEKERDRYEIRLAQAQKMEAIGTLTGGIAHDFNNMLSAIMGYTELARNNTPENSQVRTCLDQVLKAGIRARDLISQILSFSRKYDVKRQPVDVGLILGEALNLIRASIPTSVDIQCMIGPEPAFVFADPIEIHQIIMNLCTNAYQAMQEKGGLIQIDLEPAFLSDEEAGAIHSQLQEGSYVRMKITDTGSGMDSETVKYIFDPFFTTKDRDKGTGLGLATVQRIVAELKGGISVESSPGKGSSFILFFPRYGFTENRQGT